MAKKDGLGPVALSIAIARVIVGTQDLRRRAMIGALIISAAQCLVGTAILPDSLMSKPWFFLLFWGTCVFFLIIAVGLSVVDMLKLRQQYTQGMRSLKERLSDEEDDSPKSTDDAV